MKKIAMSLTAATMLFAGVTGCGDVNDTGMNNQGAYNVNDDRVNNNEGFLDGRTTQQGRHGYTANQTRNTGRGAGFTRETRGAGQAPGFAEEHVGNRVNYGAYDYRNRHGAPEATRDFDRGRVTGFGERGDRDHRGFGRGITGDNRPGMVDENGILNRGRHHNYRGQTVGRNHEQLNRGLNQGSNVDGNRGMNRQQQGATGYYNGQDGRLATRISEDLSGINNLNDPRVIAHGNDVIIAVESDDNSENLERNIRSRVNNIQDDLNVHVVTERDQVRNVRGMDDRLRAGEPFEEIGATFTDMLNDLGRAAQRPFERSR